MKKSRSFAALRISAAGSQLRCTQPHAKRLKLQEKIIEKSKAERGEVKEEEE
jgi:hypothetical protein